MFTQQPPADAETLDAFVQEVRGEPADDVAPARDIVALVSGGVLLVFEQQLYLYASVDDYSAGAYQSKLNMPVVAKAHVPIVGCNYVAVTELVAHREASLDFPDLSGARLTLTNGAAVDIYPDRVQFHFGETNMIVPY
jgi:hypothetical protein